MMYLLPFILPIREIAVPLIVVDDDATLPEGVHEMRRALGSVVCHHRHGALAITTLERQLNTLEALALNYEVTLHGGGTCAGL